MKRYDCPTLTICWVHDYQFPKIPLTFDTRHTPIIKYWIFGFDDKIDKNFQGLHLLKAIYILFTYFFQFISLTHALHINLI